VRNCRAWQLRTQGNSRERIVPSYPLRPFKSRVNRSFNSSSAEADHTKSDGGETALAQNVAVGAGSAEQSIE
jgi:hypothetical protein